MVNAVKVDFAGPCILSSVQQGASPLIVQTSLRLLLSDYSKHFTVYGLIC